MNLLFLQRHDKSQKFRLNFAKLDKKHYEGINNQYIGYITILKIDESENIYRVNSFYLLVNHASEYIKEKKMEINT